MRWAEKRSSKKKEDKAYCLLGIFDVFMPFIYGEGDNAFRRWQHEINNRFGVEIAVPSSVEDRTGPLRLCFTSRFFIQRDDSVGHISKLSAIDDIHQPGFKNVLQIQVIPRGLGETGEPRFAVSYDQQHLRSYTSVVWLNANSPLTLYDRLRPLA
jgi:hypothetical protein